MAQPAGGFSVTFTFWQYANVPIVPLYLKRHIKQLFFTAKYVIDSWAYLARVATRLGSKDWRKRSVLVLLGML